LNGWPTTLLVATDIPSSVSEQSDSSVTSFITLSFILPYFYKPCGVYTFPFFFKSLDIDNCFVKGLKDYECAILGAALTGEIWPLTSFNAAFLCRVGEAEDLMDTLGLLLQF